MKYFGKLITRHHKNDFVTKDYLNEDFYLIETRRGNGFIAFVMEGEYLYEKYDH